MELFPTIVTMARTIEVISSGMMGGPSGSLQLVYYKILQLVLFQFFNANFSSNLIY